MECCLDAALQNIYFKCAAAKIRHSHHHMTKVLEPYVRMNEKKKKKLMEPKLYMNVQCMVLYKVNILYMDQKSKIADHCMSAFLLISDNYLLFLLNNLPPSTS